MTVSYKDAMKCKKLEDFTIEKHINKLPLENLPMKINIEETKLKKLLLLSFIHGKNDFPDKQIEILCNKWIEDLKNDIKV